MGEIRIDGLLTEPDWTVADSIPTLVQIEPVQGAAPAGRTVVRVLAGGGVLVIGIRADDPEPKKIVSFSRQRDADLEDEDHVLLVLDTYLDGRSGYVFVVNPNGARYDALVTSAEGQNSNWDAIWEAAAVRTATGWSAELRIPLKSLLFGRGLTAWGFNVQRRVQRLQETDRWASPDRDVKINATSRAGRLTGLPAFDLGLGLSVRPAVTASAAVPEPGAHLETDQDLSLDLTQRVTPNTLASATINTDFAETEVDTRQTNLTRFPLFFPEKRTFFLEGSDIFDFGVGVGTDVLPFFSRRIGLLEGREVPLVAGLKVNGRESKTNFGALVTRTGELDTLPTDNTLAAIRVKRNVLRESSIGMIATLGDPQGIGGSWLIGPDLTYQTSRLGGDKNFIVGVWGLAMDRDDLGGARYAAGGKIDYPNDLWDAAFTYKWIDDGFDPSLGFVPRAGVQILTLGVDYSPRPTKPIAGLHVRQMFHEFQTTFVADVNGKWESYRVFMAPLNWRLESGDRFEFNLVPVGERLPQEFEISDGVMIPAGSYHWMRYRLEVESAAKRPVSGQVTWWFGGFYSGTLNQWEVSALWKPSPLFILDLSLERNVGHLPEGDFTEDLVGTRLRLNVSPDLQINSLVQYDNQSDTFGTNTRLRWTFSPLGDLFLVYNHNLSTIDPVTGARRMGFASNQAELKVQYAFRY